MSDTAPFNVFFFMILSTPTLFISGLAEGSPLDWRFVSIPFVTSTQVLLSGIVVGIGHIMIFVRL